MLWIWLLLAFAAVIGCTAAVEFHSSKLVENGLLVRIEPLRGVHEWRASGYCCSFIASFAGSIGLIALFNAVDAGVINIIVGIVGFGLCAYCAVEIDKEKKSVGAHK